MNEEQFSVGTVEKKCESCNKTFKRNANLRYHVDNNVCGGSITDNKCTDISNDADDDTSSVEYDTDVVKNDVQSVFRCRYCTKSFTSATSMYRHMNHTCRIKKNEDSKRNEIYERLVKIENENMSLKRKVKRMQEKINNKYATININNGTINNINNNVVLIACGNEDISKIDKNDILKGIQSGFYSTIKLTDTIHFNPKYPEYHNVYISNMKDKYAMMYDGTDWTLITKDELIDKLYNEKKTYIEENLEDFYDSLSKNQKKALDRWMETDEEHEKIKEVKEKIKLLLYNKRNVPLGIRRLENLVKDKDKNDNQLDDTYVVVKAKQPKKKLCD